MIFTFILEDFSHTPHLQYFFHSLFNCTRREGIYFGFVILPFSNSGIRSQVEQQNSCVIKIENAVIYDGDIIKFTADNYFTGRP